MFTGLVAAIGKVERFDRGADGARMRVGTELADELAAGDSIAVSGVCLTATAVDADAFEAELANQTLEVTALGPLEVGDGVNLELPLRPTDRLGGHIVQGHVDGKGEVVSYEADGIARRVRISIPSEMRRYVVVRGSVTVDGVSLTVAAAFEGGFEVSLIPETLERTTLGGSEAGSLVNIELDVIARYVERLMPGFSD